VFRPGPGLVECFGCGGGALESDGGSEEGRKRRATESEGFGEEWRLRARAYRSEARGYWVRLCFGLDGPLRASRSMGLIRVWAKWLPLFSADFGDKDNIFLQCVENLQVERDFKECYSSPPLLLVRDTLPCYI
jgi:hypothetical protein